MDEQETPQKVDDVRSELRLRLPAQIRVRVEADSAAVGMPMTTVVTWRLAQVYGLTPPAQWAGYEVPSEPLGKIGREETVLEDSTGRPVLTRTEISPSSEPHIDESSRPWDDPGHDVAADLGKASGPAQHDAVVEAGFETYPPIDDAADLPSQFDPGVTEPWGEPPKVNIVDGQVEVDHGFDAPVDISKEIDDGHRHRFDQPLSGGAEYRRGELYADHRCHFCSLVSPEPKKVRS